MKVLLGDLDEQVLQAQAQILKQGKILLGDWLQKANEEGGLEQAIDWLLGNDADRYFNNNRHNLAVQMIRSITQEYEIRDEHLDDPYEAARIWFKLK
ncbi:hypothetical protein [Polynucleobacter sinensis]|uniref:hypothetical protein n=1 Tax=Polynucleobacter sinensis TaxID=1743157 RepID=UPI0012E80D9F|nr:hypothetical protein [Polynucleobacter sinensis]